MSLSATISSQFATGNSIQLLGHCLFCLRKESSKNYNSSAKFVLKKTSSTTLEVTNQVIEYILTAKNKEWTGLVEPPTICSICAAHVKRVHQLLGYLAKVTSAIQNAVEWAGREGRVRDFLTELRASSGDLVVKRSTIKVLLQLGHLEVQQEESQLGNSFAFENDPPEVKTEDESCEEETEEFQDIDEPGVEYGNSDDDTNEKQVRSKNPRSGANNVDNVINSEENDPPGVKKEDEPFQEETQQDIDDPDVQYSDDAEDSGDDYVEEEAGSSQSDSDSEKPVRSEKPSDANNGDLPRTSYRGRRVHCDYCHDRIPKMDLRCHLRTHVGDFAVECPNPSCNWAYTTIAKLKSHLNQNQCNAKGLGLSSLSANLDTCQLCGFEASSQRSLRNHLISIHESATSKELHCPVSNCTEEFSHRQTVLCHINHEHSQRPESSSGKKRVSILMQKCPDSVCNKKAPKGLMSQHLVDDHGIPVESLVSCKYCPFVYLDHRNLVDHLDLHVKNGEAVYCHICTGQEIKFAGMRDLRQHYFEIHQVGELHRCQHCHKSSLILTDITSHVRHTHKLDRNGKPIHGVKCDLCPEHVTRQYFDPKVLLKHKINHHGAEPFRCQFCDRTFSLQRSCLDHEMEHKGVVKPKLGSFMCEIPGCGKEFSSKKTLRRHKKTILHTGKTTTDLCVECGKGFSSKNALSTHMKMQHATEKVLFVCDQCGAKFSMKGNLKQHTERVHINPMVLNCHICNRRFQKRTTLARHLAHLKPDGTCLGQKNFRAEALSRRKKREERLEREKASQQLNS